MKSFWKHLSRIKNLKLNTKFTLVTICFVVLPIAILGTILFHNMEQNVVNENMTRMYYAMEKNRDTIQTGIDSIDMSTQFFLSDGNLREQLRRTISGDEISTNDLIEFYETDIASLERLVNNNPLLYGVRVYAVNDNVQEMMPILYKNSRMQKLEWASIKDFSGWYYDYPDTIFSTSSTMENRKIISYITPITDYGYGVIGVLETAMTMQNMFPSLYDEMENEWGCFVGDDGCLYFGDNKHKDSEQLIQEELPEVIKDGAVHSYCRENGSRKQIVSYQYMEELDGTLFGVQDITENLQGIRQMRNTFIAVMALLVFVLAFVINFTVKHLLKQFYDILKSIRQVQQGNLDVVIENCGNDEMGELGSQINKMLEHIRHLMEDNINREVLVKNSEIRALQNQINAHFIYNVLESIKMMAEIDEEYAISDAITSLGKLLRYSMKWVSGNVKVEEELEYIRDYLALINLRFDYEIYLSVNIPESLMKQEIPKMSLQPIVENAIYHGIEQMAEDTNIYIKGICEDNDCVIEITDAGKGMTEEEVERLRLKIAGEIETSGGSGNGIGLKNVQDRIVMSFGKEYGIRIASMLGCYTKIMVRLPLTRQNAASEVKESSVQDD